MNATSSNTLNHDPHRRNRGIRTRMPANVSAMPKPNAAATLKDSGSFACIKRTAAAPGSLAFQIPATKNTMAIKIADVQLTTASQDLTDGTFDAAGDS